VAAKLCVPWVQPVVKAASATLVAMCPT